jgi:hypothetical protein
LSEWIVWLGVRELGLGRVEKDPFIGFEGRHNGEVPWTTNNVDRKPSPQLDCDKRIIRKRGEPQLEAGERWITEGKLVT